jgi:glutathione S-transferase
MKAPAYLAVNPMGKVPALCHGDAVVTEVCAIAAYLGDAFPAAGLAPAHGDKSRADYYRWMFFCAGPLEAATTDKSLGVVVPQDKSGFVGYGNLETVLAVLEKTVSGREYMAGGKFSMTDVLVASYLNFYMQFNSIEKRPAFERYVDNLKKRPAWQRAIAIDDKLAAEKAK